MPDVTHVLALTAGVATVAATSTLGASAGSLFGQDSLDVIEDAISALNFMVAPPEPEVANPPAPQAPGIANGLPFFIGTDTQAEAFPSSSILRRTARLRHNTELFEDAAIMSVNLVPVVNASLAKKSAMTRLFLYRFVECQTRDSETHMWAKLLADAHAGGAFGIRFTTHTEVPEFDRCVRMLAGMVQNSLHVTAEAFEQLKSAAMKDPQFSDEDCVRTDLSKVLMVGENVCKGTLVKELRELSYEDFKVFLEALKQSRADFRTSVADKSLGIRGCETFASLVGLQGKDAHAPAPTFQAVCWDKLPEKSKIAVPSTSMEPNDRSRSIVLFWLGSDAAADLLTGLYKEATYTSSLLGELIRHRTRVAFCGHDRFLVVDVSGPVSAREITNHIYQHLKHMPMKVEFMSQDLLEPGEMAFRLKRRHNSPSGAYLLHRDEATTKKALGDLGCLCSACLTTLLLKRLTAAPAVAIESQRLESRTPVVQDWEETTFSGFWNLVPHKTVPLRRIGDDPSLPIQ